MTTKRNTNRKKSTTPARNKAEPGAGSTAVKQPKADGAASQIVPDNIGEKLTRLTETNRQLKRKIFDLYTIFEISRNFSSVLNYETLLDSFILTSLAQVSASKAAIFLKGDGGPARFVMAKGKGSGPFPPKDAAISAESKLATFLARLNRPVTTTELIEGVADENERDILTPFDPGLVVPLIYQTRLTGTVLIADKIGAKEFGLDDIEFLSILGNQISVAIENARLYEAEKNATQQLRAAQQQLVHTERVAALGEMSARVAHEINNPLGIIKNYLVLIRRAAGDNAEAGNYINIVGQEIDRIARIVRELLDFHRPEKVTNQPVDVEKVVDDVLVLMDRQFDKLKIEVRRKFTDGLPLVMGSAENIKQVVLNIVINACDAMPDGGHLEITLERADSQIVMSFCDTGTGIEPDLIPRIFEPFFTTKEEGKGTGLGLAVCYGIIKRHGGTITYKNTDDGGCFEIRLPAGLERTKNE
jgi:signal transduction histidine kinase